MSAIPNNPASVANNPGLQPRVVPAETPKADGDSKFLEGLEPAQVEPTPKPTEPVAERHPEVQATLDRIHANQPTTGTGYDPFSKLDDLGTRVTDHMKAYNDLRDQIDAGLADPNDPQVKAALDSRMENLMIIQQEMHSATFAVELVSKVVEQGTSGAKNILQTQV